MRQSACIDSAAGGGSNARLGAGSGTSKKSAQVETSVAAGGAAWPLTDATKARKGRKLSLARRGLHFAAFGAVLSWSYATLSVAAKNVMTSAPDYLLIESAFTIVQWAIVGPLMALVLSKSQAGVRRTPTEAQASSLP